MSEEAHSNRDYARYLMRHMNAIDLSLGAMMEALEKCDLADREAMRKVLFKVVHDLHDGISLPIAAAYPELHPDRER